MKTSEIKANRQKWYDELISGRHKQTLNALQDEDGKCCLGVACYLAVQEGVIGEPTINEASYDTVSYDGEDSTLPPSVMEWLGFDSADPKIEEEFKSKQREGGSYFPTFSELNDIEKMSFEQIAAILKRDFIDILEGQDDAPKA